MSGIRLLPYLLCMTAAIFLSGVGVTFVGYPNPFILFGLVTFLVGAVMLDQVNEYTSSATIIGFQALCGIGAGSAQLLPVSIVQQTLSEEHQVQGTSIVAMFQYLGR
jgi:hypothetical protein